MPFRDCCQRGYVFENCLEMLGTEFCRSAKHIVTKVLRMSVSGYRDVLKNNPNVKLLHLFRDPRAIIHSRLKTYGYPIGQSGQTYRETERNIHALCKKMASDLKEGTELLSEFPHTFRFIHYEDIYSNANSVVLLHSFLGMRVTKFDLNRMRSSFSDVVKGMEYTSRKERSGNNAFWWRKYMSWNTVQLVNKSCFHVIQQLGYQAVRSEAELRRFNPDKLLDMLTFKMTNQDL